MYYGAPKGSAVSFLGNFWLPAQLDVFALGMGLAVVRAWAEQREAPTPFLERVGNLDWLWWLVAALCFHAVSFWGGLTQRFVLISGGRAYEKEFFYSFMAFFLILPAVFGPQHRGITRRFLQLRPMVYLGTISYGIYLWHQAFIEKVHQWGGWKTDAAERAVPAARDPGVGDDDRRRVVELVSRRASVAATQGPAHLRAGELHPGRGRAPP